jgi:hypothetical protein
MTCFKKAITILGWPVGLWKYFRATNNSEIDALYNVLAKIPMDKWIYENSNRVGRHDRKAFSYIKDFAEIELCKHDIGENKTEYEVVFRNRDNIIDSITWTILPNKITKLFDKLYNEMLVGNQRVKDKKLQEVLECING